MTSAAAAVVASDRDDEHSFHSSENSMKEGPFVSGRGLMDLKFSKTKQLKAESHFCAYGILATVPNLADSYSLLVSPYTTSRVFIHAGGPHNWR